MSPVDVFMLGHLFAGFCVVAAATIPAALAAANDIAIATVAAAVVVASAALPGILGFVFVRALERYPVCTAAAVGLAIYDPALIGVAASMITTYTGSRFVSPRGSISLLLLTHLPFVLALDDDDGVLQAAASASTITAFVGMAEQKLHLGAGRKRTPSRRAEEAAADASADPQEEEQKQKPAKAKAPGKQQKGAAQPAKASGKKRARSSEEAAYDYEKADAPSLQSMNRLAGLAKELKKANPGKPEATEPDKFGWTAKARAGDKCRVVDFWSPSNARYTSADQAAASLEGVDAKRTKSAAGVKERMQGWIDWSVEAALGRVSEHLREMWASDPILREIKARLDRGEADPENAFSAATGRTHRAALYKVTLKGTGTRFDGISYHGQAVRQATTYGSALQMVRKRWNEHLTDTILKPKHIGFHFMLALYPAQHWTWELIATCEQNEKGDAETIWHNDIGGRHGPDVKCGAAVNPIVGAKWADKVEKEAIHRAGGALEDMDEPTTWNLTSGGQGDAELRFTGMLIRSRLGFDRFLAIFEHFKEQEKRQPLRTDTAHEYEGKTYDIGHMISHVRSEGTYVKGYPDRITTLTKAGFEWHPHGNAASRFMEAFALYAEKMDDAWNGSVPSSTTIQINGKAYPLGRNVDNLIQRGQYIGRDPQVLSFLITLGFKSQRVHTERRGLLSDEEMFKLLPAPRAPAPSQPAAAATLRAPAPSQPAAAATLTDAPEQLASLCQYVNTLRWRTGGGSAQLMCGWSAKSQERRAGGHHTGTDTYFFSPAGKRFRSRVEVVKFLELHEAR